ncbi:MAG: hypothetical protein ACI9YT_001473 [Halobacteriales archaeon]|jgi:hypothetical protein
MNNSLVSKLFGAETWNNSWYVYVGSPVFAILGAVLYWSFGRHLASSDVTVILWGFLFSGVTAMTGMAMLAIIDGT